MMQPQARQKFRGRPPAARALERGVVLFISLIVLVALTLAGVAMIRSVDTVTQISGNLSFKQSTTLGGDAAIEAARAWLLTNTDTSLLHSDSTSNGYFSYAATTGDGVETDWTSYAWTTGSNSKLLSSTEDSAGNTMRYVIQRMCSTTGDPNATSGAPKCMSSTKEVSAQGSGMGAGRASVTGASVYYYRVTVRVTGPRNTTSYVQAMIEI